MNTPPVFLMPEEVEVLTGFKSLGRQVAWLRNKGWRFELNGCKRPIIARRYAEALLGCDDHTGMHARPNFDALRTT